MLAFAVAILVARIYGIDWLRQLLARIFGTGGQQQQSETTDGIDDDNTGSPPPLSQTTEELLSINDEITGPPPSPVSQLQTTNQVHQQEIPTSNVDIIVDLSSSSGSNDDPPPDTNHTHDAGGSSSLASAYATAERRRRTYATVGRRVTTTGNWIRLARKLTLFILCVYVIFVAFTCLYIYAH